MACRVSIDWPLSKGEAMVQAFDINAACSGYLYALQAGYDYLQSRPHGRVMVVTTEVLSPLLDPDDFDTAILFGDASSATMLYGEAHYEKALGSVVPAGTVRQERCGRGAVRSAAARWFHSDAGAEGL